MTVYPIPAFTDNYIWLIKPDTSQSCCVVDPGDAQPVLRYLHDNSLTLSTILITHHHNDHIGGIAELIEQFPDVMVVGPNDPRTKYNTVTVSEDDVFDVFNEQVKVIEVPGHTSSHIAFLMNDKLFCGDTLFVAGCGRLFEGTPEQMYHSLQKFAALESNTAVYCTHEYTQANLKFAQAVEPNNDDIQKMVAAVNKLRSEDKPSVPSSIGHEKRINPFMRCDEASVNQSATAFSGNKVSAGADTLAVIRSWKDQF